MIDFIPLTYEDGTIYHKIIIEDDIFPFDVYDISNEEYIDYSHNYLENKKMNQKVTDYLQLYRENKYNLFHECNIPECMFSRINSSLRDQVEKMVPKLIPKSNKDELTMITVFGQCMLSEFITLKNIRKENPIIKHLNIHSYNPNGYDLPQFALSDKNKYEGAKIRWGMFKKYLYSIGFESIDIYVHTEPPQVKSDIIYAMDHTHPNLNPSPFYLKELYDKCIKEKTVIVDLSLNHYNLNLNIFVLRVKKMEKPFIWRLFGHVFTNLRQMIFGPKNIHHCTSLDFLDQVELEIFSIKVDMKKIYDNVIKHLDLYVYKFF